MEKFGIPVLDKVVDELLKKYEFLAAHKEAALDVKACFDTYSPTWPPGAMRESFGYESGTLRGALLHVDVGRVNDMVVLIRFFAKRGWFIDKVEDFEAIQRRSWHLKKRGLENSPQIVLSAFFPYGNTAACRFVPVGTKVENIYQLVCPDGEDPALRGEGGEQ